MNLQGYHNMKPPFLGEVICANIMHHEFGADQLSVQFKGGFKKSSSNDVEALTIKEADGKLMFELQLNRDGIYDKLPEGLFHQTKGNSRVRTVQDAVAEHKRYKEEERQARKFFSPIEQILFMYRVFTEQEEQDALFNLHNGKNDEAWRRFWNFNEKLPREESRRLLQLMPHAFSIKGNAEATETALAYVLDKKVTLVIEDRIGNLSMEQPYQMKEIILGDNGALGQTNNELYQHWIFHIEGQSNSDMLPFVKHPTSTTILQKFEELFIPLDVDVLFDFAIRENETGKTIGSVLGYGAHI